MSVVQLLCPHGDKLLVGEHQGVLHYGHEDGSPCIVLNSYTLTCQEILAILAKNQPDEHIQKVAFFASKLVRQRVYHDLSRMDKTQLRNALSKLAVWLAYSYSSYIYDEMDATFGAVFWENMKHFGLIKPFHEVYMDVEKLPMASFDDKAAILAEIDAAMKKKKLTTR